MQSSGQVMGSRKAMGGSQSNPHKTYKRGQGSLGPSPGNSSNNGLRPGTAQKRPASPNAQGLAKQGGHNINGPSPYSFGLAQQHNNLLGGNMASNQSHGFNGQIMAKQRGNSQKPSSAPAKNRIRSQSPINIEGQGSNGQGNSGVSNTNQAFQ